MGDRGEISHGASSGNSCVSEAAKFVRKRRGNLSEGKVEGKSGERGIGGLKE